MTETKFPSETVDLPSHGWFYSVESPLSSGRIELKYPTAREEDILTSRNLIQKGVVFDRYIQSLVIDKSINIDDFLIGDKNAILVASRILGYGKDYPVTVTCDACGKSNETTVDLTALKDKEIPEPKTDHTNSLLFKLPVSKKTLTFQLITNGMDKAINAELETVRKSLKSDVDHELTTRLKHMIIAIDGDSDRAKVNQFVDTEFLSRDSRAFREYYSKVNPDIDLSFTYECKSCGSERRALLPFGIEFFWPSTGV